jgi:hypothetical protein
LGGKKLVVKCHCWRAASSRPFLCLLMPTENKPKKKHKTREKIQCTRAGAPTDVTTCRWLEIVRRMTFVGTSLRVGIAAVTSRGERKE